VGGSAQTYESCYIGPKLVHSIVIWFFLVERSYDLGFGTQKKKVLASALGLGLSLFQKNKKIKLMILVSTIFFKFKNIQA
jgi:hypothetical protein